MRIKKGDTVAIIAGSSRGKRGKVLSVDRAEDRIVVEGVNLIKKHRKPRNEGEKGEVVTLPRGINISNVALVCASCGKPVRVGARMDGETKVRYCKNCDAPLGK
ncbi:50S ribosomal protein L24 [Patescibacteria group bacterium]|nr:50S ribosomal protein L24 [Patescibacteria group bacterium]